MKRAMTIAAIATLAGTGFLLSPAEGADAATRYYSMGRPGAAAMPQVHGWAGGFGTNHLLVLPSRSVQRSPARPYRSQTICLAYRLYRLAWSNFGEPPSWLVAGRKRSCVVVPPGYQANFRGVNYQPTNDQAHNAEVWVSWHVGGRTIAAARWDYDRPRDYVCHTDRCFTGYGYANVAYISLSYL